MRGLLADVTPLRNPDYRRLWTSGIVTVIGGQLTVVAVPLQIFAITQNSAYVGLAGIFGLVPLVVFGLWGGGALADVMDRRKLIVITTLGLIGTSVLLWAAGRREREQRVVAAVSVLVAAGVLRSELADPQRDHSATAAPEGSAGGELLNMTVMQFGAIAGPLLAGVLIPVAGLSTVYLLDSIALLATLGR
ncbi:hypothetical protein GS940_22325 [Rhodococcus hoagii]|nr:hypothetical protein [Prescottella equi]